MTSNQPQEIERLDDISCNSCRIILGHLVLINGTEWIQIGGLVLRMAHGSCVNCGEPYHYAISDKVLKDFIKRTNSGS